MPMRMVDRMDWRYYEECKNIRIACGRQLVVTRDEEKEEGGTWQRLGLMYRQRRYGQ
jgi:hypothetical protein